MAKQRFKGALNAVSFPMVSILQTRTVVNPQMDVNVRTPRNPNSTEDYSDYSIPQVAYCENVVPTGEGMQSVTYAQMLQGLPGVTAFDQAITLRDEDENNFLLSPSGGLNYIYTANAGVWESVDPIVGADGLLVTRAYVNGRTFVCYEGLGIYEYDSIAGTFAKQTLQLAVGVTEADIRGIGSSSNYLLAFTSLTVMWSSLIDPLDFVPSLTTGAGAAIPQDVKGRITAVLGIAGGYIVYTTKNAVAAVYTNNSKAPFTFKEVSNAGGIMSYEQVTSEQNSGPHYAWTTGGLQKITIQGSEPVSAEINDFLAGRMWEYYDRGSKKLIQVTSADSEFPVKLAYVSSRWLIISYNTGDGSGTFNYAIIWDTTLKRYGKLKIDHVDCFYYPYPNLFGDLTYDDLVNTSYDELNNTSYDQLSMGVASDPPSKRCVGFLQQDGTVKILEMDYNKDSQHDSVIVFGKFQLIHAQMMTLQTVDLEGVYQDTGTGNPQFRIFAQVSQGGFRPEIVAEMKPLLISEKLARYGKRLAGKNAFLAIEGTFALSTYLLEVTQDGDR
jgi:hypothetical protein